MEKNIIRNENIIFEFCNGNYGDNFFLEKQKKMEGRSPLTLRGIIYNIFLMYIFDFSF